MSQGTPRKGAGPSLKRSTELQREGDIEAECFKAYEEIAKQMRWRKKRSSTGNSLVKGRGLVIAQRNRGLHL